VATITCTANTVYDGKGSLIENEENAFLIKDGLDNITIKNYRFKNVKYPVKGEWVNLEESNKIRVTDCEFFNQAGAATVPGSSTGAGILVYGQGALHNVTVANNRCTGYTSIVDTGSLNVAPLSKTVSGLTETWKNTSGDIPETSTWGRNPRVWNIRGNTSDGSPDPAIFVNGCLSRITGNNLRNCGKEGIKIVPNFKLHESTGSTPVYNWEVLTGGHFITDNRVIEYGLLSSDAVAAIDIQSPSCIVERNFVKVTLKGAVSPQKDKICYHYGNSSPFLISEYNKAQTLPVAGFQTYVIEKGVVPGGSTSTPWPDGNGIKGYPNATYLDYPYEGWIPWTTESTVKPGVGMGSNRQGDISAKLIYPYLSAHKLTSQDLLWDEVAVVPDSSSYEFYTIPNISQGEGSSTNSGGRGAIYRDYGTASVSEEVVWGGLHSSRASPLVCINPDKPDFGLHLVWLKNLFGFPFNAWLLMSAGKLPTERSLLAVSSQNYTHSNGVPVKIKMEVTDDGVGASRLVCYFDDVIMPFTRTGTTVSSTFYNLANSPNLLGSTIHGKYIHNDELTENIDQTERTNNLSYAFTNYQPGALVGEVIVQPTNPEDPEVVVPPPPPPPPPPELGYFYFNNGIDPDTLENLGDDDNDGSFETPWLTLDKVIKSLEPGNVYVGIDNGPQHPYRISNGERSNIYMTNNLGTASLPIVISGDPNSQAYLRGDIDRPVTQYPNFYASTATHKTGWIESPAPNIGLWEVDNQLGNNRPKFKSGWFLYMCSNSRWDADGVLGTEKKFEEKEDVDPANLGTGRWMINGTKLYYKPETGEVLNESHFEYTARYSTFNMKRCHHTTFDGITCVMVGGGAITTAGSGVNRDIDGVGFMDDWCSYITVKNCHFKYCKGGTSFNVGEHYIVDNCKAMDCVNFGFYYGGGRGDYTDILAGQPGATVQPGGGYRGFPVSNTLTQNCVVGRLESNDGIVFHKNSGWKDINRPDNFPLRYGEVGHTHRVLNNECYDTGENAIDITSGKGFVVTGNYSHDNEHAGISIGHYARDVYISDHLSVNDDTDRNYAGISIGDSRNVTVENSHFFNPGKYPIQIKADCQDTVVRGCTFTTGPESTRSYCVNFTPTTGSGLKGQFGNQPRNGSTEMFITPTSSDEGVGNCNTPPQQWKNILFENNTFYTANGDNVRDSTKNYGQKTSVVFGDTVPFSGSNVVFKGNTWNTASLNREYTEIRPWFAKSVRNDNDNTKDRPLSLQYPYNQDSFSIRDSAAAVANSPKWLNSQGLLPGLIVDSDARGFLQLYKSAHEIIDQSDFWDPITVIDLHGTNVPGSSPPTRVATAVEKQWTIASPDQGAAGTSLSSGGRAVGYKDTGDADVSAEMWWPGNHKAYGSPIVCINPSDTLFGLSLQWSAILGGMFLLWGVGKSSSERVVLAYSASFPHTDGTVVDGGSGPIKIRMNVENGILSCYAGKEIPSGTVRGIDHAHTPKLIPLETTLNSGNYSDTYSIKDNHPSLAGSTTHGVYLINVQAEGVREGNLSYGTYPDLIRGIT